MESVKTTDRGADILNSERSGKAKFADRLVDHCVVGIAHPTILSDAQPTVDLTERLIDVLATIVRRTVQNKRACVQIETDRYPKRPRTG